MEENFNEKARKLLETFSDADFIDTVNQKLGKIDEENDFKLNVSRWKNFEGRLPQYHYDVHPGDPRHIVNRIDFDVHEVFPDGRTLLHYAAFLSSPTDTIEFLLSQGLDANKKDNYGKTPLFYYFASFGMTFENISPLLLAGAKLDAPQEDVYFFHNFSDHLKSVILVLIFSSRSQEESDMQLILKCLITLFLEEDVPVQMKWRDIHSTLWSILTHSCGHNRDTVRKSIEVFKSVFTLIESVCEDLGIVCLLLCKQIRFHHFFETICDHVDILRFLASKGFPLDENCTADANYLEFAMRIENIQSVSYLLSIGAKPQQNSDALDENSDIQPAIKQMVQTPVTLQSLCRLTINKSLNFKNAEKMLPRHIVKYINYER